MPQSLDQGLQFHRDEGVVLDDQHFGCNFDRQLAAGLLHQTAQLHHVGIKHARGIRLRKAFQGHQQKCLTGKGGNIGQLLFARQGSVGRTWGAIDRKRIPNLREQAVEGNTRALRVFQHGPIGD